MTISQDTPKNIHCKKFVIKLDTKCELRKTPYQNQLAGALSEILNEVYFGSNNLFLTIRLCKIKKCKKRMGTST